ncbi:macro domain-containing protein [Schlesneria paludicola]|uniref:macro domain-containing protein n=1 Tax=Schlesneria paludicola TaxID=360056 RepID=UPI00029A1400|nr:macro domain-containing protein [Schlesneria paludicola]
MLHEVSGDILLTKTQAIAHGIAPNDHFDRGLALALREKWPMMATDFRHYANQCHPKPGEIWAWGGFNARVFCLITQEGEHAHGAKPGKATIANVNHCLRRLRHELEKGEIQSIALPKLATGVGGLDWTDVRPLIQSHLDGLSIPVFVYSEYAPSVQATQTGL